MNDELRKKIPGMLLDKALIGKKLRELRERSGFDSLKGIQQETGLTGLYRNEDGTQFPGWPALVKIVYACRKTLWEFFKDIEAPREEVSGILIPDAHRKTVEMLVEVLEEKSAAEAAMWLTGNIKTFHKAYVRKRR